MHVGLVVVDFTWPEGAAQIAPTLERIARNAEQAGIYSLWVMDHFFQIGMFGPPEREMLEGYTTLGFLAGQTERVKLGTLVTGVTYRHPGILLKTATTLDVLSGGRTYLGIGAGLHEQDHRGLGVPFPPIGEHFERLEETLRIAHQMWAGDTRPFAGAHYQLEWPLNSPNALQRPHPPILIGGSGERKTLRLVARYADACNFTDADMETLRHKLDVLRDHCAVEGRPYDEIEKTIGSRLALSRDGTNGTQTPEQAVEHLHERAEEGFTHTIVSIPDVWNEDTFDLVAAVTAAVAQM
ncbi:MAG: LLM class F420-dependent oxidoreductase [Thermomicrobiales bacterium]